MQSPIHNSLHSFQKRFLKPKNLFNVNQIQFRWPSNL